MEVAWPDRRADVAAGLEVLAAPAPVVVQGGRDARWPSLTEAVHWVVDDTWWDQRSPVESIGLLLADRSEAEALAAVVTAVVAVLDEVGPLDDAGALAHPAWSEVRRTASVALALMRAHDR